MNQESRCLIWGTPASEKSAGDRDGRLMDSPRAGGWYFITRHAIALLPQIDGRVKARLTSWLVDQRRLGVKCPEIFQETITDAEQQRDLSVHDRADRLLQYIGDQTVEIGKYFSFLSADISNTAIAAWSESVNEHEVDSLLDHLCVQCWIKRRNLTYPDEYTLMVEGYARLEELETANAESSKGFVAMWFDDSTDKAWEEGIKLGIEDAGYEAVRIDQKEHTNKIDDEIIAEIRRSRFVVADFTQREDGARGGVYYEAGTSREFNPGQDPYGQPCEWHYEPKPIIQVRPNQLILPSVVGKRSMDELKILESIPQIDPDRYVNLIRACRSYQNALWIAESEPNLAWLMFVSALETAANDFYETDASPDERLRASKPELATYLEEYGDAEHVRKVAELIASSLGATKKFRDFTMRFMPDAPDQRPEHETLQVNKVYDYRSRSLHGGIPFPAPMLQFPYPIGSDSPLPEVPSIGLASYSQGGTWLKKDVPINLHCFHYITRGVLLNWWRDALTQSSPHLDQDMEKAS